MICRKRRKRGVNKLYPNSERERVTYQRRFVHTLGQVDVVIQRRFLLLQQALNLSVVHF